MGPGYLRFFGPWCGRVHPRRRSPRPSDTHISLPLQQPQEKKDKSEKKEKKDKCVARWLIWPRLHRVPFLLSAHPTHHILT